MVTISVVTYVTLVSEIWSCQIQPPTVVELYHFVRVGGRKEMYGLIHDTVGYLAIVSGDNGKEKRMINAWVCGPIEHDIQIGLYSESRNLN